jgi:hypothetical protein
MGGLLAPIFYFKINLNSHWAKNLFTLAQYPFFSAVIRSRNNPFPDINSIYHHTGLQWLRCLRN